MARKFIILLVSSFSPFYLSETIIKPFWNRIGSLDYSDGSCDNLKPCVAGPISTACIKPRSLKKWYYHKSSSYPSNTSNGILENNELFCNDKTSAYNFLKEPNIVNHWRNRFQFVTRGTVSKYYFALNISTVRHACSDMTFKQCGLEEPNNWASAGYYRNFKVLNQTDGKLTTCCRETSGLDFSNTMITFENDTDVFSVVLDQFDRTERNHDMMAGFRQLSTESIKRDSESFRKFRGFNGFFVKNYYPFELFNQNRNWNHDKINMLIFFKQHFPSQFNIRCLDPDCVIYPKLFYRNTTEKIKLVDNELTNDIGLFPHISFKTDDDEKRRELNENILNLLETLKKNKFCSDYIDPKPHLKSETWTYWTCSMYNSENIEIENTGYQSDCEIEFFDTNEVYKLIKCGNDSEVHRLSYEPLKKTVFWQKVETGNNTFTKCSPVIGAVTSTLGLIACVSFSELKIFRVPEPEQQESTMRWTEIESYKFSSLQISQEPVSHVDSLYVNLVDQTFKFKIFYKTSNSKKSGRVALADGQFKRKEENMKLSYRNWCGTAENRSAFAINTLLCEERIEPTIKTWVNRDLITTYNFKTEKFRDFKLDNAILKRVNTFNFKQVVSNTYHPAQLNELTDIYVYGDPPVALLTHSDHTKHYNYQLVPRVKGLLDISDEKKHRKNRLISPDGSIRQRFCTDGLTCSLLESHCLSDGIFASSFRYIFDGVCFDSLRCWEFNDFGNTNLTDCKEKFKNNVFHARHEHRRWGNVSEHPGFYDIIDVDGHGPDDFFYDGYEMSDFQAKLQKHSESLDFGHHESFVTNLYTRSRIHPKYHIVNEVTTVVLSCLGLILAYLLHRFHSTYLTRKMFRSAEKTMKFVRRKHKVDQRKMTYSTVKHIRTVLQKCKNLVVLCKTFEHIRMHTIIKA